MGVDAFWQPFETTIRSFEDLVGVIDGVMNRAVHRDRQFAWRGQVDARWPLHSSLYRRLTFTMDRVVREVDLAKKEAEILAELQRWGLLSPQNSGRLSILNQLAMLQHYGAPTRLVDITFNAWVGVWFAVEEKWFNGESVHDDQDARMFAVDVTDRLINHRPDLKAWEDDLSCPWGSGREGCVSSNEWTTSVLAWKPPSLNARISAQNGGFLLGGVPSTIKPDKGRFQFPKSPDYRDGWWGIDEGRRACCLALRPHLFEPRMGEGVQSGALFTFRIAADAKKGIRERLQKMFGYEYSPSTAEIERSLFLFR